MVKISVIVPVYNTSQYLKKCIDSVLSQSLKDIEIIIVNDGSRDNSLEIIKSYNDARIILIDKENTGVGSSRNVGIKKSSGKYLMFLDSDDYISNIFCESMYNKAEKEKADVVVCDFYEVRDNDLKEIKIKDFNLSNLSNSPNLINIINLGPCNKLYKRSIIFENEIFFEEILKYEDAPFVIKALCYSNNIVKLNDFLHYYVIHSNSQTTLRDNKMFDIFPILNIIIDCLEKNNVSKEETSKLIISIVLNYTAQQRYVNSYRIRNKFINNAYKFLKEFNVNWKKDEYFNDMKNARSLISKNKFIMKIYCTFYSILNWREK